MGRYCSDVLIHVDETLDDNAIHSIERDLARIEGVYSACVNERARHLFVVDYDPENVDARTLLGQVSGKGLHAELIGL